MTSRDFVYWLQGFFEIREQDVEAAQKPLTAEQTNCIKRHLNLVFAHEIDPSFGDEERQEKLHAVHNGMTPEQLEKLKVRLEELEKRPQVVHHHSSSSSPTRIMC